MPFFPVLVFKSNAIQQKIHVIHKTVALGKQRTICFDGSTTLFKLQKAILANKMQAFILGSVWQMKRVLHWKNMFLMMRQITRHVGIYHCLPTRAALISSILSLQNGNILYSPRKIAYDRECTARFESC